MSLEIVLPELAQNLPTWGKAGLNEAQTSQVIVLPILQALGYDVWNPDEVAAQIHSGGGSAAYIPDFTVKLEGNVCFILEVKALNKDFSPNDTVQAVNYANALGWRWAALTNGKAWHFYDNQVPKPAADKLALTIELKDPRAATYLKRLLSRKVWLKAGVERTLASEVQAINIEIRRHLELSEIEKKLHSEMLEGFTKDEKGLKRAVQLTLEPNERELAEESFAELTQKLLGIATAPVNPSLESAPEMIQDAISAIITGMHKTSSKQRGNRSSELQARLGENELLAANWRDVNSGIVEAMIELGRKTFVEDKGYIFPTNQSRVKRDGSLYPTHAYRQLSDGSFLFLHESANNHLQRSRRMLEELGISLRTLRICYRKDTFHLP